MFDYLIICSIHHLIWSPQKQIVQELVALEASVVPGHFEWNSWEIVGQKVELNQTNVCDSIMTRFGVRMTAKSKV